MVKEEEEEEKHLPRCQGHRFSSATGDARRWAEGIICLLQLDQLAIVRSKMGGNR